MPNNFKLTGNYYVSKFGNDSWSGTSPDAPKRTLQAGLNLLTSNAGTQTLIVGAGVYRETLSRSLSAVAAISVIADGVVILQGGGSDSLSITTSAGGGGINITFSFTGFIIQGYNTISHTAGSTNGTSTLTFNNCIIKNNLSATNVSATGGTGVIYNNCIILNATLSHGTLSFSSQFNSCILINCYLYNYTVMLNSYLQNTTVSALSSLSSFNYNNIQFSNIIMNVASSVTTGVIQDTFSRYYDLSLAGTGGSGTLLDPYRRGDTLLKPFDFTNHRIAYPTLNPSSSAVDPKFNSIEDQDFTLQAGSPMIGRASDGISNIGGTKYALRRTSRISFSGSQATVDPSLIFQYDNYIISGSQVTGSITSAPIAVNTSVPKVIQKVTYNGLLAFNKDTGSASGSNQNVPDFDTFTSASGNAAANPDRLVYYMRHTTGSSIPVSDAGWDNGGLWTAGQYNVFEWNTKPSIDNLGVGNGSGSFNAAASPTYIQATYVQMQVKLRNDYLL